MILNKRRKVYVILLVILTIVIGCEALDRKMIKDYEISMKTPSTYNEKIEISIPEDSKVLDFVDSHGFHGDGESHVIIKLSEKGKMEFLKEAKESKKWSYLPLPKTVHKVVFGGEFDNVDYGDGYFEDGGHIPRNIKNGIYYFRDRFAENYSEEADIDFSERDSFNFTIAILDLDKNKLYICDLDT